MKRFIIAVLDSVGVGALPDAERYDSLGANTLGHVAEHTHLSLPNLQKLGLGNILPLNKVPPAEPPLAAWGKMAESSAGMDTTTGHWEMAGLLLDKPMPTFPDGFPQGFIDDFCSRIGRGVLGNKTASGTRIIDELGREHLETGKLIVYTSADSVFQIAAHESVVPPEQLYEYCRIARELLVGDLAVGRVIARPFVDDYRGGFIRTENRRDFSLAPPPGGLLANCRAAGRPVVAVGKIGDVFAGQDISIAMPGHNNRQSAASLVRALKSPVAGLIFANFVDFDTLYGHRNDLEGYRSALEEFDTMLPQLLEELQDEDILALCADHGNDPSTGGSDHNREYVPLLVCGLLVRPVPLGVRPTFADLGQTAAEYLGVAPLPAGRSFLREILCEEDSE